MMQTGEDVSSATVERLGRATGETIGERMERAIERLGGKLEQAKKKKEEEKKALFYSKLVEAKLGWGRGEQFIALLAGIGGAYAVRRKWMQAHWIFEYSKNMEASKEALEGSPAYKAALIQAFRARVKVGATPKEMDVLAEEVNYIRKEGLAWGLGIPTLYWAYTQAQRKARRQLWESSKP